MDTVHMTATHAHGFDTTETLPDQPEKGFDAVAVKKVYQIPLYRIRAYTKQPRSYFDPVKMRELADSMAAVGQLAAGAVRRLKPFDGEFQFELVDGERRLKACAIAKIDFFLAGIDTTIHNEQQQFEKAVVANFGRENHPPLEIAKAIGRFKDEFGYTTAEVAAKMGRSTAYIDQYYSLLKLCPEVLKLLNPALPREQQLTLSLAFRLTGFPSDLQVKMTQKITSERMTMNNARFFIEKEMRAQNISVEFRPKRDFDVVVGFLERTLGQCDLYKSTPVPRLVEILSARTLQERMKISELLDALGLSIADYKEKVDKALTSIRPKPSD